MNAHTFTHTRIFTHTHTQTQPLPYLSAVVGNDRSKSAESNGTRTSSPYKSTFATVSMFELSVPVLLVLLKPTAELEEEDEGAENDDNE